MARPTLNTSINRSKSEKNDEHYTQLADIENEVRHYRDQSVITWIEAKFKHTSDRVKILKGLDWGYWYAKYGKAKLDTAKIEKETQRLLKNKDVTKKSGIIPYLLDGDERHLSIRAFDDDEKLAAYTRQGGKCPKCGKKFAIVEMQADLITPWAQGGKTVTENCQMLCADCNRKKSDV